MATACDIPRGNDGDPAAADRPSPLRPSLRRPPLRRAHFLLSVCVGAAAICCAAFVLDGTLTGLGVSLSMTSELIMVGVFGCLISAPLGFVIWRLEIRRLPQYLLAALAIFPPAAVALALATPSLGLMISPPEGYPWAGADQLRAFDMSARLLRAGVLAPIHMFVFWLVYQRCLGPRRGS